MLTLFIGTLLKYLQPIKIKFLNKSSLLKYANEKFLIVHHFNFESQIICKQWSVFFVLYLNTNWVILCSWLNNWFYLVLTGYLAVLCIYLIVSCFFLNIYTHNIEIEKKYIDQNEILVISYVFIKKKIINILPLKCNLKDPNLIIILK